METVRFLGGLAGGALAAAGCGWLGVEYVGTGPAEYVAAALVGVVCAAGVQLGAAASLLARPWWTRRSAASAPSGRWRGYLACACALGAAAAATRPHVLRHWVDVPLAMAAAWLWFPPRRSAGASTRWLSRARWPRCR